RVWAAVAGARATSSPTAPHASPKAVVATAVKETEAHPRLAAYLRERVDPARLTGLALTVALVLGICGAIAVGGLLVMVQSTAGLARYDLGAANWGGTHASPTSTD